MTGECHNISKFLLCIQALEHDGKYLVVQLSTTDDYYSKYWCLSSLNKYIVVTRCKLFNIIIKVLNMKKILLAISITALASCASITNDPMVPVALSFSDGSAGVCDAQNKRGSWRVQMPGVSYIRRSDDNLNLRCETSDGRTAIASIPSTMGGKIIASAVFLDLGIVDSITDKHREYPASYVVPVQPAE